MSIWTAILLIGLGAVSGYTVAWLLWVASFPIVEGFAIVRDARDHKGQGMGRTLSAHVRRWFRVDTHIGRTVFLILWIAFALWFGPHITVGL